MTLSQAIQHLRRLLLAANHELYCPFKACTCGKAREHSDVQLDVNGALREHKKRAK